MGFALGLVEGIGRICFVVWLEIRCLRRDIIPSPAGSILHDRLDAACCALHCLLEPQGETSRTTGHEVKHPGEPKPLLVYWFNYVAYMVESPEVRSVHRHVHVVCR